VLWPALGHAKPHYPGEFTSEKKLHDLKKRVSAKKVPIIDPSALDRTLGKLRAKKRLRVLHLGDSHVASDYITGMVRHSLQKMYGNGGRGFSHIDQIFGYGGRRLVRSDDDWVRDRIVDTNRAGLPFGFSGISIESKKKGVKATYRVLPEDEIVKVYYQRQPGGAAVDVLVEGKKIGSFDTGGDTKSEVFTGDIPAAGKKTRELSLVAKGAKARIYGISFETAKEGLIYDSIGPVGADAKVYLELDPKSFEEHLIAHRPDLVVLMVGGNDALKIRKGWTNLDKVTQDHENLLSFLDQKLPDADCMLWTPMDAGDQEKGRIVSKKWLKEVRDMQLTVAKAHGCAVWDMYGSMGGEQSVARWVKAKLMNKDLVHPKKAAADLLGALFVEAWKDLAQP
jgi:lysophospholipase L1-like esterase